MVDPKVKVSVTLSADVVALVDREARVAGATRGEVIEGWLRRAASAQAASAVHEATVRYYRTRSAADVADDEGWVSAVSGGAPRSSVRS